MKYLLYGAISSLLICGSIFFISEIVRTQEVKVDKAIKLTEICPGIVIVQATTPLLSRGLTVTCTYSNPQARKPVSKKRDRSI